MSDYPYHAHLGPDDWSITSHCQRVDHTKGVTIVTPDIMLCETCYLPINLTDGESILFSFAVDFLSGETSTRQWHGRCGPT